MPAKTYDGNCEGAEQEIEADFKPNLHFIAKSIPWNQVLYNPDFEVGWTENVILRFTTVWLPRFVCTY